MEVWLHAFAFPGRTAELARRAEDWGFTGLLVADSQNLNADVWIELALAGAATSRLRLGPGVTNPLTRHPAVTASAAATLQEETGGRTVLGVGRGDSALSQIGRRPVSVEEFESFLEMVQAYLGGRTVDLEDTASAIRWIAGSGRSKVPMVVAATGRRTIEAAARHAEGIDFTVGAEEGRLRWAVGLARASAPEDRSLGAYLNVAAHPDRAVAADLVRGSVAILARFSAGAGDHDGLSGTSRNDVRRVAAEYEAAGHGSSSSGAARAVGDGFVERFAVIGPSEEVVERLRAIGDLGISRVVLVPGSLDAPPDLVTESLERFAAEVLPGLAP